jgi:DNA-directed RNA polymerase beta' subunit
MASVDPGGVVCPPVVANTNQTASPPEPLVFSKAPFTEVDAPRKIRSVKFSLMSPSEIGKCGVFHVFERNLYQMPQRIPLANGILDPRMGTTDKKGAECATCNGKLIDCAGHFGYVKLEMPVFHIGYFKNVIAILQQVCKTCSRVMVSPEEKAQYLRRFRSARLEIVPRKALSKKLAEKCKRCRSCPHCGASNGVVKRAGASLKIVHEKYSKNPELMEQYMGEFEEAAKHNDALRANLGRVQDDLNPIRALGILRKISPADCELLDVADRPEHLILTHMPVPPVCIRPSVEMDGVAGSNEDDVTMKLIQIIEVNNVLRQGLEKGLAITNLMENWDFLQIQCAMYINSELPGLSLQYQGPGKPLRGFVQRLKGKQGRFRGNLSGKRVDFSGRTVISPDPNLRIDEVGVPLHIARMMTYPEVVSRHNIEKIRECVRNGMNQHPGANFVRFKSGGTQYLKYGDRRRVASELAYGDVVERHLKDGDVLLFNRQPSLHKMSIMAHRARVMPWRTLRFNECVCTPYNADFDGDEMNIHCPQTEEARAEAVELMAVHNNLCTPKNGEILVAATQDFITSSYLMTGKDVFMDRAMVGQCVSMMGDALLSVDLPTPAIVKPVELWTGKQIFSILIRPKASDAIFVNLEVAEKSYTKNNNKTMCPRDGYVCIQNSEILTGQLGKATLGSGNKDGLFYVLNSEYGSNVAATAMNRVAKLSARWLGQRGFSVGIDDVTPGAFLKSEKAKVVTKGYSDCDARIAAYKKGTLALQPGCDAEQTLEAEVLGILSTVRETSGNVCLRELPKHNAPLIMALCGSKGSTINISQMVACVGQQAVGGQRPPDGFHGRSLPHFQRGEKTPAAKGFVANSFFTGLRPTEFFFHTMAGREGLVDTAVKTAETGYMSRRLMKALEDLSLRYDGTVRNSTGGIVQLSYGDDGLEPTDMEGKDKSSPVEFARLTQHVKGLVPRGKGLLVGEAEVTAALLQIGIDAAKDGGPDAARAVKRDVDSVAGGRQKAESEEMIAMKGGDGKVKTESETGGGGETRKPKSQAKARRGKAIVDDDDDDDKVVDLSVVDSSLYGGVSPSVDANGLSALFKHDLVTYAKEHLTRVGPADGHPPSGVTQAQLTSFLDRCVSKYHSKRIEPGSAVGAVGAQSIGEPGTQMTLKTFHFAGVASMNVTLGVPRIKEIINAAKNISTPIITASLNVDDDVVAARLVKGRVEKTTLGEVCKYVHVVLHPQACYLEVKLDPEVITSLQLDVTAKSVRHALLGASKLKLKPNRVLIAGGDALHVLPPDDDRPGGARSAASASAAHGPAAHRRALFHLQALRTAVPSVIVQGIPSVQRAVINDLGGGKYNLVVEGTNLQAVMAVEGVHGVKTTTNHVMEAERTLGIEAARSCIIKEINDTMKAHGMSIDARHSMLLADVMTYKGEVLGITRFGMAKMKDSVLMLASFEKTTDHLFDAALRGRVDTIDGVSECIIMGIPMPVGTGMFRLKHRSMRLEMDDEIDAVAVGEDENDALTEIDYKNDTRAHSGAGRVTAGLTIEAENLVLPKRPPLLLAGM